MKEKTKLEFELVDSLFELLRLTTTNNDEVKEKYENICRVENLSTKQLNYFKKLVFGDIPYSETKKKMLKLSKDIGKATFSGKEMKNIQRFFREQKLNQL
jgi:hypothetical protein